MTARRILSFFLSDLYLLMLLTLLTLRPKRRVLNVVHVVTRRTRGNIAEAEVGTMHNVGGSRKGIPGP